MVEDSLQIELTELDPDLLTCVSGGNGCSIDPDG